MVLYLSVPISRLFKLLPQMFTDILLTRLLQISSKGHDSATGDNSNTINMGELSGFKSYRRHKKRKSKRKAMNRNWCNQKANPALNTKVGNK